MSTNFRKVIRHLLALMVLTLSIQAVKSDGSVSAQRYKDRVEELVIEDFMISSEDPSIKLYVRNKRHGQIRQFNEANVLLFVHGATYPSETGFDLRLDGISWMDVLALQGFDV